MAVTTDITHFLADETDAKLAGISRQLAQSELTRTMILSVQGPDPAAARAAAKEMAAALQDHPEVAWLRVGPGAIDGEAIHAVYFPHRAQLLADPCSGADGRGAARGGAGAQAGARATDRDVY
jgi:predicted exporter